MSVTTHSLISFMREKTKLHFDEINNLEGSLRKVRDTEVTVSDILSWDEFYSILIMSYVNGFEDTKDSLKAQELQMDLDDMEEALFVLLDGKNCKDRFDDYSENNSNGRMVNLIRSETERVYNLGANNAALRIDKDTEDPISKTWETMEDERVRDTHSYLQGVTVGLDDKFYTYDGDSAMHPFGFSKAENNDGCRCYLTYSYGARESS